MASREGIAELQRCGLFTAKGLGLVVDEKLKSRGSERLLSAVFSQLGYHPRKHALMSMETAFDANNGLIARARHQASAPPPPPRKSAVLVGFGY